MTNVFPASRIAHCMGWRKARVLATLAAIAPDDSVRVSGNLTSAWSFASLPLPIQKELERISSAKGFRSVEEFLSKPEARWQPSIPKSEIPGKDMRYAQSLQAVLAPLAQAQGNPLANFTEEEENAATRYRRVFRIAQITTRHIQNLLAMVLERDRGFEEWARVEIYLPARYSTVKETLPSPETKQELTQDTPLSSVLSIYEGGSQLSIEQRSSIWLAAVETFFCLEAEGWKSQAAKKAIRGTIMNSGVGLVSSSESCKKLLNQKIDKANREGITAIKDGRERSGNFRRPDFSEDQLKLISVSNAHQGNVGLAHRLLYRAEGWRDPKTGKLHQFSQEYRDYISLNMGKNKSYVPHFMRALVRGPLKSIEPLRIGPKAARLARPSRSRDWGDFSAANNFHTSDDETANSMVYFPCENGKYECEWGRFDIGRPQILPLVDERTTLYLALQLSFTPGYSADTIRELIFGAWNNPMIGLPNIGLRFEQGIWESNQVAALADLQKLDPALSRYGRKIEHATTPKAKIIERVFGSEQNRTSALPGYVGRGKADPRREPVDKFLAGLKLFGQPRKEVVDPREQLLSFEGFHAQLQGMVQEYNAEPQNGKMLHGRSPEQAWEEGRAGKPAEVLPSDLEWLITTKEQPMKVSTDGIILKIGTRSFQFVAEKKLGMLVGETVLVRFTGREPDHILYTHPATDPQGRNPQLVPIRQELPATTATKADFQRARNEENLFTSGQRQLFSIVSPKFNLTKRDEAAGPSHLKAAGRAIAEAQKEHSEEKNLERKAAPKARELGRRHGLDISGVRAVVALENLTEAERLREEIEAEEHLASFELEDIK